ncbi:hypothetical protein, partial [Ralstonia solanacearum]
ALTQQRDDPCNGLISVSLESRLASIDHVSALECIADVMAGKGLTLEFQCDGKSFSYVLC